MCPQAEWAAVRRRSSDDCNSFNPVWTHRLRRRTRDEMIAGGIRQSEMAWTLKGQMFENCSCNMFCPCWFAIQEYMVMDQGWCATSITYEFEQRSEERRVGKECR